jgi:hypothetical protein
MTEIGITLAKYEDKPIPDLQGYCPVSMVVHHDNGSWVAAPSKDASRLNDKDASQVNGGSKRF